MLRRLWSWLTADRRDELQTNSPCPICGLTVAGEVGSHFRLGMRGYWAPTREELIAHCPEHGRAPYNSV